MLFYSVGSEEDKMVRVPRDMYTAIYEIIKEYPHYGWKGPSEFVRDAIRRYVKEIREREVLLKRAMGYMPQRIEDILRSFMGEEEARELSQRISEIQEEDSEKYLSRIVEILQERTGPILAELLARKLMEAGINED